METIIVQRTRTTVDLLLWRRFGIAGARLVEATLQLNPGLAGLGPVLPIGTKVVLPDAPSAAQAGSPTLRLLDLFGGE
jgi:phage tail protein X